MADKFDCLVIGAGPGGYVAAIRAAQLGLKTAIVEKQHMGGICLNWGCIPTKALLKSAEVADYINHAEEYGIKVSKVEYDLKAIVQRSRDVAAKLSAGIEHLMKKNKITVFKNLAKINGKGKVRLFDNDEKFVSDIDAKNIIIATGARARILPNLEPDNKIIWTYKEAMVPEKMPKKLLVVGSGAIGIEFASFYNSLGVEVYVVELADRILPVEDKEISEFAKKEFEKKGFNIFTNSTIDKIKKGKDDAVVTVTTGDKKQEITVDRIISAVGVVANTENIGLEGTNVKLDRGTIVTDKYCQTNEPGIYAIGDVTAAPWLAHKASHEGVIAAEHIAGLETHSLKKENIPGCTYSNPQIASIGLTEDKAKEEGYEVNIGRFPFMGNGKAIASGKASGLIKVIFNKETGELLGAHMIGAEVTEMIQGYAVGKSFEATEEDFMNVIFPHPTLSEMMHEAVLDAYGKALHI